MNKKHNSMLTELIYAADTEKWDTVDAILPSASKQPDVLAWAVGHGLLEEDGNRRDLAVSILEASDLTKKEFGVVRKKLYGLMNNDVNQYVRYRAAFTLAKHGTNGYRESVKNTLLQAQKDKDVAKLATDYLKRLKK